MGPALQRTRLAVVCLLLTPMLHAAPRGVAVTTDESAHRVDVTIDGKPFTAYLWDTNQRKPVLYPLIAPDGTTVTRGYPFAMRPGERVDHPHHAGLWFNYGNANNFDFWNNSDAIKVEDRPKYGTITHDRIVSAKSGADSGELTVESTWTTGAGDKIFTQTTKYVFSRITIDGKAARAIDMVVTLKALSKQVVFHDDKEGVLGIRVAHFLESACITPAKALPEMRYGRRAASGAPSPEPKPARPRRSPSSTTPATRATRRTGMRADMGCSP
jgi:hypothetical protein